MTIDEFLQVQLKIGKVLEAEKVDGSEKLLKLKVDFGEESRQVLSGIAKSYAPEEIIGKEFVFVTNLEPRQMMGMESQAMILAAVDGEGKPVVLIPEKEVPPGSGVR
jgi:methionine--tRNA ligase beta chain